MKTLITGGYVYCYERRRMERKDICIENGIITDICEPLKVTDNRNLYDAKGKNIIPGFIDIHTHGGFGVDVNAASKDEFQKVGHYFAMQGTTSWLASILTDTEEQTIKCLKEAVAHKREHVNCADFLGIHLEGPFLSVAYKGAMPESLLKNPDMELLKRYQNEAEGNIKYITVSPEIDGIPEAIPKIKELGITVAIGHSGADYETTWQCIVNGATSCTHICNAMKQMHQHFPAIMGAALESDIYCEIICDGHHLHPGIVRFILKAKGYDRVIGITDSIMAAGLPDGEYKLGINHVVVKQGDAKLKSTGVRAGSTLTTGTILRKLIEFTGDEMEDVLPIVTMNPAKLLGIDNRIGSLEVGKDADLLIVNDQYDIIDTFVKGTIISK